MAAELVATQQTTLPADDVIVRAVQYFTNGKWRAQSQSQRVATFVGIPPIPWVLMFCTYISFFFFLVPGIIMYFFVVRKVRRLQNIVVSCNPNEKGTEVVITYTKIAKNMVDRFLTSLPTVPETAVA